MYIYRVPRRVTFSDVHPAYLEKINIQRGSELQCPRGKGAGTCPLALGSNGSRHHTKPLHEKTTAADFKHYRTGSWQRALITSIISGSLCSRQNAGRRPFMLYRGLVMQDGSRQRRETMSTIPNSRCPLVSVMHWQDRKVSRESGRLATRGGRGERGGEDIYLGQQIVFAGNESKRSWRVGIARLLSSVSVHPNDPSRVESTSNGASLNELVKTNNFPRRRTVRETVRHHVPRRSSHVQVSCKGTPKRTGIPSGNRDRSAVSIIHW